MHQKNGQDGASALSSLAHVEKTASGEERMSLDLRDVERADSALMAGIVLLARRCRARGVSLTLLCSASVLAWIELCRLDGLAELVAC